MRVLLVEDNITTANYLSQGLKENYFVPEVAHDGQEGLFLASNNDYAVIILDVMLPVMDGWSLIKIIREKNPNTPILFLTAKDTVDDRVKGLELGADDYLVKPFAFSELLARIRALLRRKQPQSSHILQIADLKLDTQAHTVVRNNNYITLTAKEFMLLALFANKKGEVLSRTYIAEKVWDINFDSDTNAIDVAINRLREKMDKPFDKKLIHCVRGVGYVLEER
ncbi:two-component system response regulator [Gammaproteobacteria bacterium SCGC AG-212-F23]|nr:two-component system response regulator [Gammaproteobacteria bacterium SCGC AG-212-F23]